MCLHPEAGQEQLHLERLWFVLCRPIKHPQEQGENHPQDHSSQYQKFTDSESGTSGPKRHLPCHSRQQYYVQINAEEGLWVLQDVYLVRLDPQKWQKIQLDTWIPHSNPSQKGRRAQEEPKSDKNRQDGEEGSLHRQQNILATILNGPNPRANPYRGKLRGAIQWASLPLYSKKGISSQVVEVLMISISSSHSFLQTIDDIGGIAHGTAEV